MKIDSKDFYHGAALTAIVEHRSFKALNKADEKYGHYQVNHDTRLLVKHTEKAAGPWQFTFGTDDLETLQADVDSGQTTFAVLVCGKTTICLLNKRQFSSLLDLGAGAQQWIRVKIPTPGASLHVTGSRADLKNTVPHNVFPRKIFA